MISQFLTYVFGIFCWLAFPRTTAVIFMVIYAVDKNYISESSEIGAALILVMFWVSIGCDVYEIFEDYKIYKGRKDKSKQNNLQGE